MPPWGSKAMEIRVDAADVRRPLKTHTGGAEHVGFSV